MIDGEESAHVPHFRPGEESQGIELQGDVLGLQYIKTAGATDSQGRSITKVRVERGELVGERKVSLGLNVPVRGTAWIGARLMGFKGGFTYLIRVANVIANPTDPWKGTTLDSTGSTYRYDLQYWVAGDVDTGAGAGWFSYCKDDVAHASKWAVPVKGVWDAAANFQTYHSDRFTFACTAGAAFKCQAWGYFPWKSTHISNKPIDSLYNACIRMARADYCGNGKSFTVDGTRVNVEDTVAWRGFTEGGFSTAGMSFESAWRADGAVCLSHARWANLVKPEELCGDSTAGPWTYTNKPGTDDVVYEIRGPRQECNTKAEALLPDQPWQNRGGPPLMLTQSFVLRYPPLVIVNPILVNN